MLTGMAEKSVKANGIFAVFVGLKADAAQERVGNARPVEKAVFCAAQIHKVQCCAPHYEQSVVGIGRIGAAQIGQVTAVCVQIELAHAHKLALVVDGLIGKQIGAEGNTAARAKRFLRGFFLDGGYGDHRSSPFR